MARRIIPAWRCHPTSNHAHDYRLTRPDGSPLPYDAPANDHSEARAFARVLSAAPRMVAALDYILDCDMRGDFSDLQPVREAFALAMGEES